MNSVTSSLLIQKLVFPVYFLIVLFVAIYTYNRPAYNPDMLVYMAIASGIDKHNYSHVQSNVYSEAKKYMPATVYSNYTDSVPAPITNIYHDPSRLYELVPQHAVKPLYILSIKISHFIGFNLVQSTLVPTTLSFIILGLMLFKWIRIYFDDINSFLLCLPLVFCGPVLSTAKLSTPDMMAATIFICASYILFEKKNVIPSIALLILSIYARIDYLIPSLFFIVLLFFRKQISVQRLFILIFVFVLVYLSIFIIVEHHGLDPFYIKHLMKIQSNEFITRNLPYNFFNELLSDLITALRRIHLAIFTFIGLVSFALTERKEWLRWHRETMVILLLFISMIIRSLLHPYFLDRFFIAYYLLIAILTLKIIHERIYPQQIGSHKHHSSQM